MSLLAWYPLMGNTKNYGLGDAEPTITATPVYIDGKMGKAMSSGGIKWLASQTKKILNNNELTIAFWLYVDKLASESSGNTSQLLFGNDGGSSGRQYTLFLYPNVNTLHWSWGGVKGGSGIFSNIIPSKQWTHVCVTYKNPTGTVYINGVQTNTFSTVANADSFEFDTQVIHNYSFLHMQDYRIYDHALSKKEVKELSKGLCIHVPLDWGANPNMIKNSYTWMNKNAGSHWVSTGSITKAVIEDNTAPCRWVYKVTKNNSAGTSTATGGAFYGVTVQGLALEDLVEGETYTYSFWAKADASNDTSFNLAASSVCESQTLVSSSGFSNLDSNWRLHTVTFKWTKTTKLTACFYCNTPAGKTQIFYCCGLKLEKGSVATPYIPHVEEAAYTSKGYANLYKQECSGFKKNTTTLSAPINGGDSPKGCSCTYFDGTDDGIQIDESAMYKIISDKFTISFWIKPDGEAGARSVYFGSNGNTYYNISIEKNASNQLRFYWNNGSPDYHNTAFTIADNTWQHIAIVRESATSHKFYKNGTLVNTYTTSCAAQTTASPNFYIGRDQRTGATCYKGYMSDFRLYASALSANDIKELYQIPAQIDKSGKIYCNTYVEV